jgi:hypothetical protein
MGTRVTIHQPQFNPYLGTVSKFLLADKIVFLDTVQFVKNEFQNRNRINLAGRSHWLTVPVYHRFGQRIEEVRIDWKADWRKKHLGTLCQAYRRAPFFSTVFPSLSKLYENRPVRLVDWNRLFLLWMFERIELNVPTFFASQLETEETDPNPRLISLVRELGGEVYLAGSAGTGYMERSLWAESGIEVEFMDYTHPRYPHHSDPWLAYRGVMDLLFEVPSEEVRDRILSGVRLFPWPEDPAMG